MRTTALFFTIFILICTRLICQTSGIFFDLINKKEYKTIKIGERSWIAENLNSDRFRNGDLIPQAKTKEEWNAALKSGKPAWCYFENNPSYALAYGKLYNYFAVNDSRGLAPRGWHISSNAEWQELINYLEIKKLSGSALKSNYFWNNIDTVYNKIGFNGVPSGVRFRNGEFTRNGELSVYWIDKSENEGYYLQNSKDQLDKFTEKGIGISVRCVKD
jgi:uncharacterized protein (TIGR02145 family)